MAAAIKMEELLVSWLASDTVYENVLNLVETKRAAFEAAKLQQQQLVVHDSNKSSLDDMNDMTGDKRFSNGANDSSDDDERRPKSPRSIIPKFYMVDSSRPRRRRRLLPMPQAESWEPLPEGERQQETNEHNQTEGGAVIGESSVPALPSSQTTLCVREQVQQVFADVHQSSGGQQFLTVNDFARITKLVCRFPSYFNVPLFHRVLLLWNSHSKGSDGQLARPDMEVITFDMFEWFWKQEMEPFDAHERFFRLCKQPENDYILRDDFLPFIKALLNDHPGLEFLSNHAEFQEKYAVTVITRIFYCVDKCHSGRIACRQIRRSDLLEAFQLVDEEEDINKVTRYFSYEHFYVLYCRFWELDHDRDYRITREDLLKYGDHSLSHMVVDRIFDAAPRPFSQEQDKQNAHEATPTTREFLSYEDFIYFMLSEEDKANEVSVRYWFTCVDVDGDGKLNNMEMRSFYAVQLHRMQCMGHEIVPFEDMLCQMMDMIKPSNPNYLVAEDFLQPECAPVAGALFDALFNLNKYLLFEQRDPFVERQKREDEFETDWDRFACIDYNRLAMEEEAREEEAMEIDWVTVDDDEDHDDFNAAVLGGTGAAAGYSGGANGGIGSSEAPF